MTHEYDEFIFPTIYFHRETISNETNVHFPIATTAKRIHSNAASVQIFCANGNISSDSSNQKKIEIQIYRNKIVWLCVVFIFPTFRASGREKEIEFACFYASKILF